MNVRPKTPADLFMLARRIVTEFPEMSDEEAAQRLGCEKPLVVATRKHMARKTKTRVRPADKGLSELQKNILSWVKANSRCTVWGASTRGATKGSTSSERAAISRALRRLEERGLIVRQNDLCVGIRTKNDAHVRGTHLVLTEEGKAYNG